MIDILNSFPESQFILVGDSGEQDMELYATVAMERPQQILAVFIRDARTSEEKLQPVEDPIGATAHIRWKNYTQRPDYSGSLRSFHRNSRGASNDSVQSAMTPTMSPGPTPNYKSRRHSINSKHQNSVDYFSRPGGSSSIPTTPNDNGSAVWLGNTQIQDEPMTGDIDRLGPKPAKMPDTEWRRLELQMRVDRARVNMPQSVRFRLFVHPEECAEAIELLDWLNREDIKLKSGGTNASS